MEVVYSRTAVKVIKMMDNNSKVRIRDGIEGLVKTPPIGDIKQMQGLNSKTFRLRIGKYRVIYEYIGENKETLFIKDIGSRGDIYK